MHVVVQRGVLHMLSNVFKWIGAFTILSGFIVGIVQGNASSNYDSFGWGIALTWFFSGIVSGALFFAISEVLDKLDIIAYNTGFLRNTSDTFKQSSQSTYPTTGKSKPSLESLSKTHTFRSND